MDKAHDKAVAAAVARGRAAWPELDLPDEVFGAYLREKLAAGADLAELPAAELYLCCACARGDATALARFRARYFADLGPQLARMKLPPELVDEVVQILSEKFFVAPPGQPPKILALAGQGDLGGLVRVAAVRTALNLRRRDQRLEPDHDAAVLAAIAPEADPELAVMKAEYRVELARGIEEAVRALEHRDRNVLRLHLVHRLSIDEIGALYHVHRSTAARWLERIRAQLEQATRARLRARFGIADDEVNSVIRLVESRLDVSFQRLLATS